MFGRNDWWICTKCSWKGDYQLTKGVMYKGVDWQHCPSCDSIAIPLLGRNAIVTVLPPKDPNYKGKPSCKLKK